MSLLTGLIFEHALSDDLASYDHEYHVLGSDAESTQRTNNTSTVSVATRDFSGELRVRSHRPASDSFVYMPHQGYVRQTEYTRPDVDFATFRPGPGQAPGILVDGLDQRSVMADVLSHCPCVGDGSRCRFISKTIASIKSAVGRMTRACMRDSLPRNKHGDIVCSDRSQLDRPASTASSLKGKLKRLAHHGKSTPAGKVEPTTLNRGQFVSWSSRDDTQDF